jgi:hypothetical protein
MTDRRRAPFLGLPVFEIFWGMLLVVPILMSFIGPLLRWLFRQL